MSIASPLPLRLPFRDSETFQPSGAASSHADLAPSFHAAPPIVFPTFPHRQSGPIQTVQQLQSRHSIEPLYVREPPPPPRPNVSLLPLVSDRSEVSFESMQLTTPEPNYRPLPDAMVKLAPPADDISESPIDEASFAEDHVRGSKWDLPRIEINDLGGAALTRVMSAGDAPLIRVRECWCTSAV